MLTCRIFTCAKRNIAVIAHRSLATVPSGNDGALLPDTEEVPF